MRKLIKSCMEQRGCEFCLDSIPPEDRGTYKTARKCPHVVCPYHELDEVDSFGNYLEGISDQTLAELLKDLGQNRASYGRWKGRKKGVSND